MARYGQKFKDRVVVRLLPPESAAVEAVSQKVGISVATLERWRSEALANPASGTGGGQTWTAAARLEAVITTAAMDEATRDAAAKHDRRRIKECGARVAAACDLIGIDRRTWQRWRVGDGLIQGDRRRHAVRPTPSHALSAAERVRIITVANEPRFAETPPARIVPTLADEGVYIASEASSHRVLRAMVKCVGVAGRVNPAVASTSDTHCRPTRRRVVLGCDLLADTDPGTVVLSLHDPGPL